MGKILFQLYIWQGINNQNIHGIPKTKLPKNQWHKETFSKEEVQMATKHMKKCSTTLTIKEMWIKTTLRFHLTPVRIVISSRTHTQQQMLVNMWIKGNLHTLLVGM
jgi:hypothetical protein